VPRVTLPRLVAIVVTICSIGSVACRSAGAQKAEGRLDVNPHAPHDSVHAGMTPLGLDASRDGFLFVPAGNSASTPAPLLVMLHGATQRARLFERLTPIADSAGVAILAVDSRDMTWDAIRGEFGVDVDFLQRALARAFDRAFVDRCRVVVGGFSDGASYALSLGIRNTGLFHGVIAFSPGFLIPARDMRVLPIFIRHGQRDQILPIDATSRRLVDALNGAGFDVDYEEFDGPHTMRPSDARASLEWTKRRSCGT
jgi:phospholipase/carboxylesterase